METLKGRIALELGARGAKVAVNYFAKRDRAEQLCEQIKTQGGEAAAFYADVRLVADVEQMVKAVKAAYQQIDIVVINAPGPQPFLTIEEQTWERYLDQL